MNRHTLFVEQAEIITHQAHAGGQFILQLRAPKSAALAQPGQFAHVQVHALRPMRRPISIMRAGGDQIELLYKVVGEGTALLSQKSVGESLNLIAPIGQPFHVPEHTIPLMIGGGVGMPPLIFLASRLRSEQAEQALLILGSEIPFPFECQFSERRLPGIEVNATHAEIEAWGIACRLCSQHPDQSGIYHGWVTELAEDWLAALSPEQRQRVILYACGPEPMLKAVVQLAARWQRPVQISLEEYMACGIGGCAGCTVPIQSEQGLSMKRVCVDGPVFNGYEVYHG